MKKSSKKAVAIILICCGIIEFVCGIYDKRFSTILLGAMFCLIGLLRLFKNKGE